MWIDRNSDSRRKGSFAIINAQCLEENCNGKIFLFVSLPIKRQNAGFVSLSSLKCRLRRNAIRRRCFQMRISRFVRSLSKKKKKSCRGTSSVISSFSLLSIEIFDCRVNLSASLLPEWNEEVLGARILHSLRSESSTGVIDSNHDCSIFSIVIVRCNVMRTIELFFDKSDPTGTDRDEHRMSIEASLTKEERCEGMNITAEILLDSDQEKKRREDVSSMIYEMTLTKSLSPVDQS